MNGVEWGIDSSVFILIQGTNHQQLKQAGARLKANKRRFFKLHVAAKRNMGCFGCQGFRWVQGWAGQVHRKEIC